MPDSHSPTRPVSPPAGRALTIAGGLSRRLVRTQFLLGLITVLLAAVGLAAYGLTDQSYSQALTAASANAELVADLGDALVSEVLHTRGYLITADPTSATNRELAHEDVDRLLAHLAGQRAALPDAAGAALDNLRGLHGEYDALTAEMIGLEQAGQAAEAVALFDARSDPLVVRLLEARRDLRGSLQADVLALNEAHSRRTVLVVAGLGVGFLALAVLAGPIVLGRTLRALAALDTLEQTLAESAEAGLWQPLPLPANASPAQRRLLAAYNDLARLSADYEAGRAEFISRVAHDLRSPLAVAGGYAALLAETPAAAGEAAQYVRAIRQQTARMEQTLDRMVTAARIDAGQLDLRLAPLRLADLLRALAAEMAQPHRPITVQDDLGPALVLGDALRLRELFYNLLDNALKFSPAGAPVAVRLAPGAAPGQALITITDQGPGIAPADLPRLFRRFGRLLSPVAGTTGSGLGLYIARHIAEQHHGAVTLDSQPGQGATARVTLPLDPGADGGPDD